MIKLSMYSNLRGFDYEGDRFAKRGDRVEMLVMLPEVCEYSVPASVLFVAKCDGYDGLIASAELHLVEGCAGVYSCVVNFNTVGAGAVVGDDRSAPLFCELQFMGKDAEGESWERSSRSWTMSLRGDLVDPADLPVEALAHYATTGYVDSVMAIDKAVAVEAARVAVEARDVAVENAELSTDEAQQAIDAAVEAEASKVAAAGSAVSAAADASDAIKAGNFANESAAKAGGYATDAAMSATRVSELAEAASSSKSSANQSASIAKTSESNAKASENLAKKSETAAISAKNFAETAASGASDSATDAASSATAAAESATVAGTKATESAGSASSASGSASSAKTSASNAKASEGAAKQSETAAISAKNFAETAASGASDSATDAASSAETAGQKAEAAESSASSAKGSEDAAAASERAAAAAQVAAEKARDEATEGIKPMTKDALGGAICGEGLDVTKDGVLSVLAGMFFTSVKAEELVTAVTERFVDLEQSLSAALAAAAPIGVPMYFAGTVIPKWFLLCNGAVLRAVEYPELFAVIGRQYIDLESPGDMFCVPDLRGLFLRGFGGNSAAIGKVQPDAIREIVGSLANYGITGETHAGSLSGDGRLFKNSTISLIGKNGIGTNGRTSVSVDMKVSGVVPTAVENRPVNMAFNIIMRYK